MYSDECCKLPVTIIRSMVSLRKCNCRFQRAVINCELTYRAQYSRSKYRLEQVIRASLDSGLDFDRRQRYHLSLRRRDLVASNQRFPNEHYWKSTQRGCEDAVFSFQVANLPAKSRRANLQRTAREADFLQIRVSFKATQFLRPVEAYGLVNFRPNLQINQDVLVCLDL